jgi:hypothetical protein
MVVNQSKTKVLFIGNAARHTGINFEGVHVLFMDSMKVLGVLMDKSMKWSAHISTTINKMTRLTGALRFLRRRLDLNQFLQVLTSQYYGACYYAN